MAGGIKDNFNRTGNNVTPKKIKSVKIKSTKPKKVNTKHSRSNRIKVSIPKTIQSPKSTTKTTPSTSKKASKFTYDRAAVKRANERLRKMEKVYSHNGLALAEYNTAYQARKHDLEMNEKSGGSIFKRDTTGLGVRYLSEKEFNRLSDADKERFNKNLQNWLDAASSQKGSFEKAIISNYDTMNENYDLAAKGINKDDWLEVLRVYHTKVVPNDNSHYGSKVIIDAIDNLDIPNMSARDLEKAMQYIIAGRQDKIPREWWQETY